PKREPRPRPNSRSALWKRLRLPMDSVVRDHDPQPAFVALVQYRPHRPVLVLETIRVAHFDRPRAQNLKAILELLTRIQALDAEAGTRIVHLNQRNRLARLIRDARTNISRVAPGHAE